jgi:tetratricopeptide (TPR) repeat protein
MRLSVRASIVLLLAAAACVAADDDDAVRSITAALRSGRAQEAVQLAREASRKSPRDVRILVLEGMALAKLRNDQEALATLRTALEISPEYLPALEAAVEIEYRRGDPEAARHLEMLVKLRPDEPTAYAMLGALAWKSSDCASAAAHFSRAQTAIADQPEALREFGACLMKLKRAGEAAGVFERWLRLRPEERRARYALAAALMDAGRPRDAIETLGPLARGQTPDVAALELSASAYEVLGETQQAVASLRKGILLDPHNVDLYLDFAALSFTHQSFQVGIDMINAGLTQAPDSGALYLARGVLYVQLAEYAKADADFDRAERLDPIPGSGAVARGLSQIQQNHLDEALVTVRSQLQASPGDFFLHYTLAELLSRQGAQPDTPEFRAAVAAAKEAVRLKPDFVLARDVLSRLYLESGETELAIEQCRLALRDNPSDEMALYRLIRALQSSGHPEASAEVPALLQRFTALREDLQKQHTQQSNSRLVEVSPATAGK